MKPDTTPTNPGTRTDDSGARIPPDPADYRHIPGWGADIDRADRPAHPMERTPPRLPWVPPGLPPAQPRSVEVLCSNEHQGLTPVFGTTLPPKGLSGWLRRAAFGYSENDLRHWLMLLGADRVDVVEGLVGDLARGHVPNLPAEMGWRAEWRHNRAGAVRKLATLGALAGLAWFAWQHGRRRR